jgi:hypothetical protein
MSIADTYRAMSTDIRQAAATNQNEDVRRAYLALAEMWATRAVQLDADDYRRFHSRSEELTGSGGATNN